MKHAPAEQLGVSRETAERLAVYVELLRRWNGTINLVAPRDLAHVWERHIADSLQIAPLIPKEVSHVIDLGSGAGLPGLVLSVATGLPFHLIEADQRKAAFLREAARQTQAPVQVHAARIESARPPPAPVITARALAPLSTLLRLASLHLAPGGICLFPKGRGAEDELTAARSEWHMLVDRTASRTDSAATILRISEIGRVGYQP